MRVPPVIRQLARRTTILLFVYIAARTIPDVVEFPRSHAALFDTLCNYVAVLAMFFQGAIWANAFVVYWTDRYIQHHAIDRGDATTIQAVAVLVKIAFWAVLLVAAFEALGKNVAGLITTLGVGGVAIAFALQNVLSDVFGAMSIVFDKPFVVGDTIGVDAFTGTVERIGLKSTRARSLTGEQIIFANGELLKGKIRNYGRMGDRQALFAVRVAGDTPPADLQRIPGILSEIITARPDTRLVYAHLKNVADTSVDFEAVCYLTNTDYGFYMQTLEAVWLEILRRMDTAGIQMSVRLQAADQEKFAGRDVAPFPASRVPAPPAAPPAAPPPAPPPPARP